VSAAPAGRLAATAVDAARPVSSVAWTRVEDELETAGCAVLGNLLSPEECRGISAMYGDDARFRSRVVMSRHGFGRGEYKYFGHPLPPLVRELRPILYERLVRVANRWSEALREPVRFPERHAEFLERSASPQRLATRTRRS